MKDLAIILLNYNGSADTVECIQSLDASQTKYIYDIYVMDNGSQRENLAVLESYIKNRADFRKCTFAQFKEKHLRGNLLIDSGVNAGFAGGNNKVIREIYTEYANVLLLNNDTVVSCDFLEKMLDLMNQDEEIGFSSCRIDNYYDRTLLWNCGGALRPWGLRKYYSESQLHKMPKVISAEFITGCALFIRNSTIEKYGALSDDFFHGEEDFNFCWRMKRNCVKGKCLNRTLVYHKVSATSEKSGSQPGKMVGYYVYRIVDMRQFYPVIVWNIWRSLLYGVLMFRWRKAGYTSEELKKMHSILLRASKLKSIDRADTLKIWRLEY